MGEELINTGFGQLFYKTEDGQYKLVADVREDAKNIIIRDELDEQTYASLPQEGTLTCTFRLQIKKTRSWRIFNKVLKTERNRVNRWKRRVKRMKEKFRRKALKRGEK